MKKAQRAHPNQRLKQERELRGWSQNDVARQLGVEHYYLSRWERGMTVPSPYYRQKLCALFGKNADELGLLHHNAPEVRQEQETSSVIPAAPEAGVELVSSALMSGEVVQDTAIPLLFASGLVGRDGLLAELKQRLCSDRRGTAVVLSGLPGVGKTTLAAALVHDPEIATHFAEGVLWAGLGPTPDVTAQLSRWGSLLGLPSAQAARLKSSEEWVRALRVVIGTRRLLLVIDDAWRIEAALAFKVGGPNCSYLLTTRFPPLALQFAPEGATTVGELSEEEGVALLTQLVPEMVTIDPASARLLVRVVGGLPLALTIAGSYLRTQSYGSQPRRIRTALARLQDAEERLLLTRPSALAERSSALPADTPVSLQTIIAVSEQQLSESARSALRAVSIFPPKPNSFSEEAAVAVSGSPVEALDELSDAGLLESSGPGRYTLHQVIADYASFHLTDREVSKRLVTYITSYVAAHTKEKEYELLERESSNIVVALRLASSQKELAEALVRCTTAFTPFLLARGLYVQAEEFLLKAEEAVRSLQNQAELVTVLYHLGKIQIYLGKFSDAEAYFRKGLTLARQEANDEKVCQCLSWLGVTARYGGDYQQANQYYEEALALARQIQSETDTSVVLMGLGTTACELGDYPKAESYLGEGVALARATGDLAQLCSLLVNSGQVAYFRGDYTQGDSYTLEALQIARQIGYLMIITTALSNLGATTEERGQYAQAEAYVQEALQLSKQLENPVQIGYGLVNLGEIALKQEHDEQAEEYLREALALARQLGRHALLCDVLVVWGELELKRHDLDQAEATFREIREMAEAGTVAYEAAGCYGLARVALERGQHAKARALGEKSVRIFKSIGHRKAAMVETWLQEAFS
ncbi:MAG: tetratricopeptide repeat protein [Ktedonobacteraceae bacterium]